MDLSGILTSEFIFSTPPVASSLYLPLLIIFGLMILAGVSMIFFLKGDHKKIWGRYEAPFITAGILGLIHLGARYEQLSWFASRFFLILVITALFIWLLILAISVTKILPEHKKNKVIEDRFNKYLPKSKK